MLQPVAHMEKWTMSPLSSVVDVAIRSRCLNWDWGNFGCLEGSSKEGCYLCVPLSPLFCCKVAYFWFPSEAPLLKLKLAVTIVCPVCCYSQTDMVQHSLQNFTLYVLLWAAGWVLPGTCLQLCKSFLTTSAWHQGTMSLCGLCVMLLLWLAGMGCMVVSLQGCKNQP